MSYWRGTKDVAPTLQQQCSRISPKTANGALGQCDKKFYPCIFLLLKSFVTLAKTTNTYWRETFSALRPIKTYPRNRTEQAPFDGLTLLNIHRKIEISPKEVLVEHTRERERERETETERVNIGPCDLN